MPAPTLDVLDLVMQGQHGHTLIRYARAVAVSGIRRSAGGSRSITSGFNHV